MEQVRQNTHTQGGRKTNTMLITSGQCVGVVRSRCDCMQQGRERWNTRDSALSVWPPTTTGSVFGNNSASWGEIELVCDNSDEHCYSPSWLIRDYHHQDSPTVTWDYRLRPNHRCRHSRASASHFLLALRLRRGDRRACPPPPCPGRAINARVGGRPQSCCRRGDWKRRPQPRVWRSDHKDSDAEMVCAGDGAGRRPQPGGAIVAVGGGEHCWRPLNAAANWRKRKTR